MQAVHDAIAEMFGTEDPQSLIWGGMTTSPEIADKTHFIGTRYRDWFDGCPLEVSPWSAVG